LANLLNAGLQGILEGLTEFLPISSTGHLILIEQFIPVYDVNTLGIDDAKAHEDVFNVVIQFPAILAIMVLYFRRLLASVREIPARPEARRFWAGLGIAFLPAAVLGLAIHHQIEEKLYAPVPIAIALIVGGIVLILADRFTGAGRIEKAEDASFGQAIQIGLFQAVALLPGVSRSGATIIGARLLGLTRTAAAEYSFFLALPTMLGAFVYKLYKARGILLWDVDGPALLVGGVTSFVVALVVVAFFIKFLQKHGLGVFGWYRIALGILVLALAARTVA